MANKFDIPGEVERRIRERDKKCIYCHKEMIYPWSKDNSKDSATIEHLREEGPFYWNDGLKEEDLAICCGGCNSSRGKLSLLDWFKSRYCLSRGINENTVAGAVKIHMKK